MPQFTCGSVRQESLQTEIKNSEPINEWFHSGVTTWWWSIPSDIHKLLVGPQEPGATVGEIVRRAIERYLKK